MILKNKDKKKLIIKQVAVTVLLMSCIILTYSKPTNLEPKKKKLIIDLQDLK